MANANANSACPFSGEMVRQARVLAQATSDLVNAMRSDAEAEVDLDNSKKLLAAAKLLADATARMVEAAKVSDDLRSVGSAAATLIKPADQPFVMSASPPTGC